MKVKTGQQVTDLLRDPANRTARMLVIDELVEGAIRIGPNSSGRQIVFHGGIQGQLHVFSLVSDLSVLGAIECPDPAKPAIYASEVQRFCIDMQVVGGSMGMLVQKSSDIYLSGHLAGTGKTEVGQGYAVNLQACNRFHVGRMLIEDFRYGASLNGIWNAQTETWDGGCSDGFISDLYGRVTEAMCDIHSGHHQRIRWSNVPTLLLANGGENHRPTYEACSWDNVEVVAFSEAEREKCRAYHRTQAKGGQK